jgi:hypothetical protein
MSDRKLILPAEIEICATCTYWDGERSVDGDVRVVVVCESCQGECLLREAQTPGLSPAHGDGACLWDDLDVGEPPSEGGEPES